MTRLIELSLSFLELSLQLMESQRTSSPSGKDLFEPYQFLSISYLYTQKKAITKLLGRDKI